MKVNLLDEGSSVIQPGCLIVTDVDVYTIMPGIDTTRELNCYMLISLKCNGAYFTKFNNASEIIEFIETEEHETIRRIVKRERVQINETGEE